MKNKVIALVALSLAATVMSAPSHAAEPKTLAIIDSGFNTTILKDNIVAEACFIEYGKCPNGQASMTGSGAAALAPTDAVNDKTFSHGTQMAYIAKTVNPSVRLVLIRIVGRSDKGYANTYTIKAVSQALAWIQANPQLQTGAISMSIGRSYSEATCPTDSGLRQQVATFKTAGVAIFASAGNGANQSKVDYPACIPDIIAVGATDTSYKKPGIVGLVYPIMFISNGGADLDVYALGRYNTVSLDGTPVLALGTSAATAAVASKWTQSISQGQTYESTWNSMVSKFENAYRTTTDYVKKQYNLI